MPETDTTVDVELRLPADGAYASVLRTTTAALAARLDFTMGDIEDLRIAVTEAGVLALGHAAPHSHLTCRFALEPTSITVTVTVPTEGEPRIDEDSFAWQVLTTLARTTAITEPGHLRLVVAMASSLADQG